MVVTRRKLSVLSSLVMGVAVLAACTPTEPRNPVKEVGPQTLHERTLTLDTHVDIPLDYMTNVDPGPESVDYAAAFDIAETRFRAIQKLLIEYPEQVQLCVTADEVREAVAEGKRAVLIGMENAFPLGPAGFPFWVKTLLEN